MPNQLLKKAGTIKSSVPTDDDMIKINKHSLKTLTKDDVYVLKMYACDNETDDRNYEPFDLNALKDMQKLYIGKAMIKNHKLGDVDNQFARVFDSEITYNGKKTNDGEEFASLTLKAYMLKNETNKSLIDDIEAGIKKEVSTDCVAKHLFCSICGLDNTKNYCSHWWGREYDTKEGKKTCYFTIGGVKDVLEVSLVPCPAQPRAGMTKAAIWGSGPDETKTKEEIINDKPKNTENDTQNSGNKTQNGEIETKNSEIDEAEADLFIKTAEAFIYTQKSKEMEEE